MDGQRSSVRPRLDSDLELLRAGARRWASLPVRQKVELLIASRSATSGCARRWTACAAQAKGVLGTPLQGEEAIAGPWAVLVALNRYIETLRQIERFGAPQLDERSVRRRAGGQIVVNVFPQDAYDRVLLNGVHAEVWMQPDVTPATLRSTMGVRYREANPHAHVTLVLAAGNITAIAPLDVLHKLVADGAACMLKMHPLLDWLGPILEEAFAPLVAGGYLAIAYGGADVGRYLCAHSLVDEIHITGSRTTYDAILADGGNRKPITSELGNVSPTIVVPGRWSEADLRFQAEHIVTTKLHNAGFNCVASQVLILPAHWNQRTALVACIERAMRDALDRPAYYPGAGERCARLIGGRPVRRYGRCDDGFVSRTIVDTDAADLTEPAFHTEAFCTLLVVVTLPGDLETFVQNAVLFANERLWGNLAANLIAHPVSMRQHASALNQAVAHLRYGCIGINAWSGVGFLLPQLPWGAFRDGNRGPIESGEGVVHNTLLFARSQKAVVHAPFAPFPRSLLTGATFLPKPPWFVTNRNQAKIGAALCDFEVAKSPAGLAAIAFLSLTA